MRALDLVIIIAYLGGVLAAGAWFSRRQKTTRHYFVADGRVPWWAIGASIVATETSTVSFISIPGVAFARGGNFTFLQLVFGYLVGRIVICLLFIPSYFQRQLVTVYELLHNRFGRRVTALAASLFVVMRTIADGVRLLLTAIVLAAVYRAFQPDGDVSAAIAASIVIIGLVMILFTFWGGIEAVVWVEVVQLGIYIAGAIAAAVVLAGAIPGGVSAAIDLGSAHGKFRLFDFAFDLTKTYGFWAGLIGGCFLTMSTHGTDQFMVQRYLSTDGPRNAALGLLASGVVVLLQFIGFLFIGVLLFAYYRPDQLATYATGPAAAPFTGADQVFPDFITRGLPSGISGLVVAAIFAAAMSSSLSAIASTAVADLYSPVVRGRSDRHYLNMSRLLVVIAGIVQIVVALGMQGQKRSAVDAALSIASLINGPILGVFLLGAASRGGPASGLVGMTAGLVAVMYLRFATTVAWPWYTVVGSLTTLLIGLAAAAVLERRTQNDEV